jgi:glycosyltransferase involved in cell wall biosynthesis
VRFLGQREDMPELYSAFDVFVLPSYREGFSRSGMEAAACGCAMVLSDIRGCREIGTHGEHLLLTPPGDAEALTAVIVGLVDDADLRVRLGAAAQARAHAQFDQRAVAEASLQTYAQVAASRGLPWADAMPTTVARPLR